MGPRLPPSARSAVGIGRRRWRSVSRRRPSARRGGHLRRGGSNAMGIFTRSWYTALGVEAGGRGMDKAPPHRAAGRECFTAPSCHAGVRAIRGPLCARGPGYQRRSSTPGCAFSARHLCPVVCGAEAGYVRMEDPAEVPMPSPTRGSSAGLDPGSVVVIASRARRQDVIGRSSRAGTSSSRSVVDVTRIMTVSRSSGRARRLITCIAAGDPSGRDGGHRSRAGGCRRGLRELGCPLYPTRASPIRRRAGGHRRRRTPVGARRVSGSAPCELPSSSRHANLVRMGYGGAARQRAGRW